MGVGIDGEEVEGGKNGLGNCPELDAKAEWVGRNGDGVWGNGEEENVGLENEVGWSCKLGHVHGKYHLKDISSLRRNRSNHSRSCSLVSSFRTCSSTHSHSQSRPDA